MSEQNSETQWYIAREGQQHGPLTETELKLFVSAGHLQESDLVWQPGFTDWKPAFEVFPPGKTQPTSTSVEASAPGQPVHVQQGGSAADTGRPRSGSTATSAAAATSSVGASANTGKTQQSAQTATASTKPQTNAEMSPRKSGQPQSDAVARDTTGSSQVNISSGAATASSGQREAVTNTSIHSPAIGADTLAPTYGTPAEGNRGSGWRRLAIAAGVVGILAGGGWFAFQANPQLGEFANAALNIESSTNGAALQTASKDDAGDNVVAAPDTPTKTAAIDAPVANSDVANGNTTSTAPTPPTTSLNAASNNAANVPNSTGQTPTGGTGLPQFSDDDKNNSDPDSTTAAEIETAAIAPQPEPSAATNSTIDTHYTTSPLWTVVRAEFPEWYGERIKEIEQLSTEKPKIEVTRYATRWLVLLRRENAQHALAASTSKLRTIATRFLDNLRALKSHSTEACYSFISKGETSPAVIAVTENKAQADTLAAQSTAIFQAIAEGKKTQVVRQRPQKPDYDILASELGQLGWSQADLQLFANPQALAGAAPERVCQMVQDWFSAHITIKDEAVQDRLLYETLRPVISG